ncbi:MAG TPA: antibiotic biosynthesis monooxygenase, partial [Thermoanaerobaculia bacterium]|nr:antibiotic biosynthesis monooxygenase [Thermoanaerobaculia bacterium]
MIARLWHGAVPAEKGDAYYEFLLRTGVADYKATPGNLGVHVFRRIEGGRAHFLLTSFWESEEA